MKPSNVFPEILKILKKEYPKWNAPVITLMAEHQEIPFKILIATILSARTKDEVTAKAVSKLFKVITTPADLKNLSIKSIEKLIYPVGFYHTKAKALSKVSKRLVSEYNSAVPSNIDNLLKFEGVGRKTANLVLSRAFNIPAICVDIHVHRISNRLGIVETRDAFKTEIALQNILPKNKWSDINTLLVAFGQTICKPINPKCEICLVKKFCKYYKE